MYRFLREQCSLCPEGAWSLWHPGFKSRAVSTKAPAECRSAGGTDVRSAASGGRSLCHCPSAESQAGWGGAGGLPVLTAGRLVFAEDWIVTELCRGLLAGGRRGAWPHSRTAAPGLAGLHPAFFPADRQLAVPSGCASLCVRRETETCSCHCLCKSSV